MAWAIFSTKNGWNCRLMFFLWPDGKIDLRQENWCVIKRKTWKKEVQRGGYFQKRKKAGIFSDVVVRIHWDRKAECAIRHSGEMAGTDSRSEDWRCSGSHKRKTPIIFFESWRTRKDYGGLTEYGKSIMKPYQRFNPVTCVNSDALHNRSAISDSLWRPWTRLHLLKAHTVR